MPELGHAAPGTAMRDPMREALGDLSSGRSAERMRLHTATRLPVVVRRVMVLQAAGLLAAGTVPLPEQRRAVIERIAGRWKLGLTTATDFARDLPPRDAELMVELATV